MDTVSLEDCLEGLAKIPSGTVDMVCTDPPYFLDGLGSDWNKRKLDERGSSSLVGKLPKGMKFDRNQSKNFKEFYSKISEQVFRVLKPGGAFVSFSSPRLYHAMASAVEDAGFEIRDMMGWIYTQSQVKAFAQDHIIENDKTRTSQEKEKLKAQCQNWKTPQLKPAIEPMCLAVKPIEGRYIDNFEKYGTGLVYTGEATRVGDGGNFPANIMTTEPIEGYNLFLIPKPNKEEKGDFNTHLSVKPIQLISQLIKLFTQEGALVVDPFMGSGTTAVACIKEKRHFMGFEINKEYVKIALQRIQDAQT